MTDETPITAEAVVEVKSDDMSAIRKHAAVLAETKNELIAAINSGDLRFAAPSARLSQIVDAVTDVIAYLEAANANKANSNGGKV